MEFIARSRDGESLVGSTDELEAYLAAAVADGESELWLMPATAARQLGSLALRVFGLKPRPAVVAHLGPKGALVTFRDRNGGDYRVVNREYVGQADRGMFVTNDGRRIAHRLDEVLPREAAFDLVRDFFREGDRPWRISCRSVTL